MRSLNIVGVVLTFDADACQDESVPDAPQYCTSVRELDDLELLCGGALRPVEGFNESGSP